MFSSPMDLEPHRGYLFALLYRMTGSAADAEDAVQETFARAVASPPPDRSRSVRSWLTTVAMNLGRDQLRKRRRLEYRGPWLPEPVETEDGSAVIAFEPAGEDGRTLEGRYDLLESVQVAFLLALEALTPRQRAVLLLRDVFDHSTEETAQALSMPEGRVRVTLHRARKLMATYDGQSASKRTAMLVEPDERPILGAFMEALLARDTERMTELLAEDAVAISDGGKDYFAAKKPVVGAAKIAQFYAKLADLRGAPEYLSVRRINGAWALVAQFAVHGPSESPRVVTTFDVRDGKIARIYSAIDPRKLSGVRFTGRL